MGATGGHKRHHNLDKGERPHDANSAYHNTKQQSHEKLSSQHSVEKSKNVSHVPCKFFRQSICQAGDKCPFSHDLDNDHPAVCKYFQKGNCKFGSKCALAHITPDGRHVNKHTREPKKKEHKDDDGLVPTTSRGDVVSKETGRHDVLHTTSPKSNGKVDCKVPHAAASNSRVTKPKGPEGIGGHADKDKIAESVSLEKASVFLSKFSTANPQSPVVRSYSDLTINTRRLSHLGISENVNGLKNLRALSHDVPISTTAAAVQHTPTLAPSLWPHLSTVVDGSAITDDEDDDAVLESSNTDDEDGFCEQLVPSTLEDLLTPRERERRKSRETLQKPNRVLSSPSSKKTPLFTFRRGSAPITESTVGLFSPNLAPAMAANNINHLNTKVRSVSNSSSSVNNGSNARSSDLWSPRNLDTPFSRPPGFNSPPRNPGAVGTGALFAGGMNQTPLKYQVAAHSGPLAVGVAPAVSFSAQHEAYMVTDQIMPAQSHFGHLGASVKMPITDTHSQISDPFYSNPCGPSYGGLDAAANVGNQVNGLQSYATLVTENT